ncbi:site-specific tyrosine recombinase XerC [Paracoccus haematequi]|uniref:Site-specific tyrosine recombinase XerC n=1 Tax=Paracoccus haematequi TaxID=2491866 RepID=A0A447IKA9_9RHOB|nr:site-specific tyrosine recombinase XerC [Paracoccus haematequi]
MRNRERLTEKLVRAAETRPKAWQIFDTEMLGLSISEALGAAEDQRAAGIIRMCMLTGARLGEVRTAQFQHFDLDCGAWVKPAANTKQRRIHDLRHTFASLLVSGGVSLEMIGKLLGHSQSSTTMPYAPLMDSPLRAGVDAVAEMVRIRPRLVHSAPSADDVTLRRAASARSA